jgi:hypothetical protein
MVNIASCKLDQMDRCELILFDVVEGYWFFTIENNLQSQFTLKRITAGCRGSSKQTKKQFIKKKITA